MRFIEALCDREAPASAQAGKFVVVELTEHDEDVSYLIDEGTHFSSVRQLQQHLVAVTGDDVDVREVERASSRP
jgi:hypothetical protein